MMKCNKCGEEPKETDKLAWKCTSCGKAYGVTLPYLQKIQEKKNSDGVASLVKCKECGEPLDKGDEKIFWKCSCGNVQGGGLQEYGEKVNNIEKSNLIKCPDCGREVSRRAEKCPNCGCPVEKKVYEITKPQQVEVAGIKMAVKTRKFIIGIIIVAILCAGGGIGYKIYSDYKEKMIYKESYNGYIDNLEQVRILMLSGSSNAESLCNLTLRVWGNAISKKYDSETDKYTNDIYGWNDFNTALENLYADSSTITKTSNIESNQISVKNLIKKLQNPPEGLDKCYDTVSDLYEAYNILTDLGINPSGSYTDFGTKKSDAVSDFMSSYEKLDNQIPKKLEDK
ncbi:MAG: hypothetical protein HFH69_09400 [Lachnospiraceae bacterium]|nr:hypothetical protein [Lachnospiraceae bacterium]